MGGWLQAEGSCVNPGAGRAGRETARSDAIGEARRRHRWQNSNMCAEISAAPLDVVIKMLALGTACR
jgi:hypothetical protein